MSQRPDPVEALHAALLSGNLSMSDAAKAIGRSAGVLYNKFSDSMPGNEVTAREALALADAIQTTAYAEAVAEYFGGVFFKLPPGIAADDDVLQAYLSIVERMGELSHDLTEARDDGVIDSAEFARLRNDSFSTIAAIQTMLAELETMVREAPASPQIKRTDNR